MPFVMNGGKVKRLFAGILLLLTPNLASAGGPFSVTDYCSLEDLPLPIPTEAQTLQAKVQLLAVPASVKETTIQRWHDVESERQVINAKAQEWYSECMRSKEAGDNWRGRVASFRTRCQRASDETVYHECLREEAELNNEGASLEATDKEVAKHAQALKEQKLQWYEAVKVFIGDEKLILETAMANFKGAEMMSLFDKAARTLDTYPSDTRPDIRCNHYFHAVGNLLNQSEAYKGTLGPEWTDPRLQANDIYARIAGSPDQWESRDPAKDPNFQSTIQNFANQGVIVVGILPNDHGNGHVAIAVPEPPGYQRSASDKGYVLVRDGNAHRETGSYKARTNLGSAPANYAFSHPENVSWYIWKPSKK